MTFYAPAQAEHELRAWLTRVYDCDNDALDVRATRPEGTYALSFEITLPTAAADVDDTELVQSSLDEFGPTLRIKKRDARTLVANFTPVPASAQRAIDAHIASQESLIDQWSKRPLRFYVLLFCVALVCLAACGVLLHNHWHAYAEPWHTPLEFIAYHLPAFLNNNNNNYEVRA